MARGPSRLTVSSGAAGRARLLTVGGLLDSSTYMLLRDSIIKAALDEPAAVLVDIAALEVPALSALSVFTSARWHVSIWPDIPILLVCPDVALSAAIVRGGVSRYVPVRSTVEGALQAITDDVHPPRRRASAQLPASNTSLRRARDLTAQWLGMWSQPELIPTAKVVVDVLVENVLLHTDSAPLIVLESTGTTVTVAVQDTSSAPAIRSETPSHGIQSVSGLAVLATLCRSWGSAPTPTGKTVWAVIDPGNLL